MAELKTRVANLAEAKATFTRQIDQQSTGYQAEIAALEKTIEEDKKRFGDQPTPTPPRPIRGKGRGNNGCGCLGMRRRWSGSNRREQRPRRSQVRRHCVRTNRCPRMPPTNLHQASR